MRTSLPFILTLVVGYGLCYAQRPERPHSPRLSALEKKLAAHEAGAEDALWRQLAAEGTPIVEDAHEPGHFLVTFVWRGTAATHRVQLTGPVDPPQPESDLARVPGSNIFATTLSLPDTGRFTYFFIVDGDDATKLQPGHAHHDPLSRHPFDTLQSILELPRAPKQPSIVAHSDVPTGTLWRHTIRAATPQQQRQLFVYTPPGYSEKGPVYPLLVAFDGETATGVIPTWLILDELIAAKRIPPVVALFIGNVDRMHDLAPNPAFADFVALDLVPWMRAHYRATSDPRRTVISGISLGGLASAHAAFRHPEVFGNVLSQSGSFWWGPENQEPEQTARDFAQAARLPLRFWMEVGSFEIGGPRAETTQLAGNRHLRDVLRARGYDVSYQEFAGNHTYVCWRGTLADGLAALFGTPPKLPASRSPRVAARPPLDIASAVRSSLPVLVRTGLLSGGDAALAEAKRLFANNADSYALDEDEINGAGCMLMTVDHPQDALGLLHWNTERFPKSANTWDSLAWAYYQIGDRLAAIANFKEDVRLDPKNAVAAELLTVLSRQRP
ncbi:MAG: putative esterase [Myxococcales bacterium]|nr:putative esterase [Myxococcales bacterium]